MSKNLVVYFSVSGVTARAAKLLAQAAEAEIYEIKPLEPYTPADLDWTNPKSRSTVEMQDLNCRPAFCGETPCMKGIDTVYVGFPVWWGREPSIVDSFIDAADFAGAKIVPFCTSGGSDIGGAAARIAELTAGRACIDGGMRIAADAGADSIKALIK